MRLAFAQILAAALISVVQAASLSENNLSPRDLTTTCKARAKPAAICGKTGTADFKAVNQFLDPRTCARYCSDLGNCGGFTHRPENNLCTLFPLFSAGDLVLDLYKVDPKSNTTLYTLPGCFSCKSSICDVSPDFNLLNNADFELSKTEVGPWDPLLSNSARSTRGLQIISNPVGQGNAVQFSITAGTNTEIQTLQQYRQLCQGQRYRVQVDYKVDQVSATPPSASMTHNVLRISLFAENCNFAPTYTFDDAQLGKWHHLDCSFEYDDDSPIQFFLAPGVTRNTPKGASWNVTAANFRMTQLPAGRLKTKGASRVRNGGFESGKLAPFTVFADYTTNYGYVSHPAQRCTTDEPVYSIVAPGFPPLGSSVKSKYKFRFCGTAGQYESNYYNPYTSDVVFQLKQNVSTEVNKTYVLSTEYDITNGNLGFISYGPVSLSSAESFLVGASNTTRLDQRILSGIGGVSTLLIEFLYSPNERPLAMLQVFVDNISIKELDE